METSTAVRPVLSRIMLYPVKALDPSQVMETVVSPGGALLGDREYAIVDEEGRFVNGKRNPRVHLLRSAYDPSSGNLSLAAPGIRDQQRFILPRERVILEEWLSGFFGMKVTLRRDARSGFPDDTLAYGPTVVSSASLAETASWFPGLSQDDVQRRFRPNLVISGVPPFWEDRLFAEEGTVVEFRIGEVMLCGVNPCARCVVPTRNPETSVQYSGFQVQFMDRRKASLPPWSTPQRFDHYYRLSVNTRIDPFFAGVTIRVGQEVEILGKRVV